jgi:hypothetical protein
MVEALEGSSWMLRQLAFALAMTVAASMPSAGAAPAASPPEADTWTVTPVAFCRYDVDVSKVDNPHLKLEAIGKRSLVVCPFASSTTAKIRLFTATADKTTCGATDLPGFSVLNATALSAHDYNQQSRSCMATLSSQREPAPGKIYMITYSALGGSASGHIFGRVAGISQYGGLPIHYITSGGWNNTEYLCLEMSSDADIDPLLYFKSASVDFPPSAREVVSSALNCMKAVNRLMGIPDAPSDAPLPTIDAFQIRIRGSSSSPTGPAFDDAFLTSLADAGLPHAFNADRTWSPLKQDDTRPLVIEDLAPSRVEFEIRHLTEAVCAAAFATMAKTQGFIQPPDDQSPTIVLKGTTGAPPPRYQALAIQFVASAPELCAALQPAFDRWAASPTNPG